jgi:hypothetical protein
MAENYTPTNVTTFTNDTTAVNTVNNNFAAISTAFSDCLSLSGSAPNQMKSNLDMNSNSILNLPPPATINSPARLIDVASNPTISVPPVGTSGATVPLLNAANTWSNTQTFNPPNTNSQGILVSSTATGSTSQNPYIYNSFSVSDNLSSPGINCTLNSYMGINGSNVNNSRQAFQATLQLLQPTNAANSSRFYVAAVITAEAVSGDGGGAGTEKGQLFCLGPKLLLDAAATHMAAAINTEFDIQLAAGSSSLIKYGVLITQLSADAVSGSQQDSAMAIVNQAGAIGWGTAIQFGDAVNAFPLKTTGTLLNVKGTPTYANGINLGSSTITGNAWNSTGYVVAGTGALTLGTNGGTGGQITLNGSTSGSCQLAINSTATSLFIQAPLSIGIAGGLAGVINLNGSTSGTAQIAASTTGSLLLNANFPIQYSNAASFTANGAGAAVTISASTPAAITTPGTIFKWMTAVDSTGTTIYWPVWH